MPWTDEQKRAQRVFDFAVVAFPLIERWLTPAYREALASIALAPGRHVLDVGTGSGALAAVLCQAGHHVVGVDVSPKMLRRARRRVPAARFEQRDITGLEQLEDRSFELVTFGFVLHGLSAPLRRFALEQARRLASEHVLIFDHGLGRTALLDVVEALEGPHYFEYLKTPLSQQLWDAGLIVQMRGRTRQGIHYWVCVRR